VNYRQRPRCLWCGGGHHHHECPEKQNSKTVPTFCNCHLQDRQSQRLQSCKTGITVQKKPAGDQTRVSRENILLKIHNTQSIICCCSPQLWTASLATTTSAQQQQSSGHPGQKVTNQTSGQSVQAKKVNSNATNDMFLAFTIVPQIMT
jgi:hypothetical protein